MSDIARASVLRAREAYLETGDIRYAAIAIGKADEDDIPKWALDACRQFARTIVATPPKRRTKRQSVHPDPASHDERAYEFLLDIIEASPSTKFSDALDQTQNRFGVDDGRVEGFRKLLGNWWKLDLEPPDPETADDPDVVVRSVVERHRRLRERMLLAARGHRVRPGQGKK